MLSSSVARHVLTCPSATAVSLPATAAAWRCAAVLGDGTVAPICALSGVLGITERSQSLFETVPCRECRFPRNSDFI